MSIKNGKNHEPNNDKPQKYGHKHQTNIVKIEYFGQWFILIYIAQCDGMVDGN